MTKPRYQHGCSVGSKVPGLASSAAGNPDYAWNVNFNNGNSNWNNRNNNGVVLAVRGAAREYQGAPAQVTLRALYDAWREARRQKSSHNQLAFEAHWLDNLLKLQDQLNTGTWTPAPSVCFIATKPKAREIHAPAFADRIVHHYLVPRLEQVFEPVFIFDSYANRTGKGTHAAVRRLQHFVRQVESGQGGGYYLQLDIANFFNSIHRPTLWALLKPRLERAGVSQEIMRTAHALLRKSPLSQGVTYKATAADRAQVPAHKRLENAPPGCGLPIGNLSSQFFANVYLNELDQFVKHELKATRYLRYVDDFVLVHESREQLEAWLARIRAFLADRLKLQLKADVKLRPLADGVDFLGYVVLPTHTRVRPRVVAHAREKLWHWQRRHARADALVATPAQFRELASIWASYLGHCVHANSYWLEQDFHRRFPWLATAARRRRFDHRLEGRPVTITYRSNP